MNLQYRFPAVQIRLINNNLSVKSSGPKKCRVKDFRTVGSAHYYHTFVRIKSIHLHKQLVQCLFPFVVSTHRVYTSCFSKGIEFINEDYTWRLLVCLAKQVSYSGRSHAHKHLNKFGATDIEKWYPCLSCNGLCQKSLSGSRSADQEYAFRDFSS